MEMIQNDTQPVDSFILHPAERRLIEYIRRLKYGTIVNLKVQDGLPMIAEEILRKVKFIEGKDRERG